MNQGMRPILIFDVRSLVGWLIKNKEETFCGGRNQHYSETLDRLFSRLSKNAELVFFLDGFIMNTKFAEWARRQDNNYNRSIKVIDMVNNNTPLRIICDQSYVHTNTILDVIEASCIKHGQLFYAVTSECDQEIARFASKNHRRVLGVISHDSDFLIFPGKFRYFSTISLNAGKLTTIEFDRKALRRHLKLNSFEMSIFATMAGNDIIQEKDVKKSFLKKFGDTSSEILPAIARFIREVLSHESYSSMLRLLGDQMFSINDERALELLDSSIMSYSVTPTSEAVDPSHVHLSQHNLFIYNVLNKSPFCFSLVFFDLRQSDIPSYYYLSVPMFQRQAGVILKHSSTPYANLTVYTKLTHSLRYNKINLPSILPPFDVPSLEELYSDDRKFDVDRFKLLKWTLGWENEHLKDFDLQEIPDNYMIDDLTIVLMIEMKIIDSKEADIFLWTIKNVENKTIPKQLRPPAVLDPRAFRLAFIYVRLFPNVQRSIEVSGLKKRYWVS